MFERGGRKRSIKNRPHCAASCAKPYDCLPNGLGLKDVCVDRFANAVRACDQQFTPQAGSILRANGEAHQCRHVPEHFVLEATAELIWMLCECVDGHGVAPTFRKQLAKCP